ncbi:MAG: thiolase family protein [Actinomycetota bacterium]|nr:thiolase family protein [Actinomycetota bacterium]
MNEVYIAGIGMTNIGHHDEDAHELGVLACVETLRDAGVSPSQVESLISTPHGYMAENRKFTGQRMADYLGIAAVFMMDVDSGGNSSSVAMHTACDQIELGKIGSCLVYASQKEFPKKYLQANVTEYFHLIISADSLYDSYQAAYGVISPLPSYAMAVQRYMYRHGVTAEDIARVVVLLREHALKHPQAAYGEPVSLEEVLSGPMVSPPMHRLESSEIHDGAAAVLLVSGDLVRERDRAGRVTAIGEAHDATSFIPHSGEIDEFPCVRRAARQALERSGYTIENIDVAEVYGAFAGVELMMYEELGFFEQGEAPAAVREGRTIHGGEVLLNPSGGRLSLGYLTYATPLLEMVEIVRQLRGGGGGAPETRRLGGTRPHRAGIYKRFPGDHLRPPPYGVRASRGVSHGHQALYAGRGGGGVLLPLEGREVSGHPLSPLRPHPLPAAPGIPGLPGRRPGVVGSAPGGRTAGLQLAAGRPALQGTGCHRGCCPGGRGQRHKPHRRTIRRIEHRAKGILRYLGDARRAGPSPVPTRREGRLMESCLGSSSRGYSTHILRAGNGRS